MSPGPKVPHQWHGLQRSFRALTAVPLITAYYDKVGKPTAGARKQRGGPRFSLVEYKETIKASSYIDVYSAGRMMWKRQYVEWAQTLDGGKKTEKQAEAQWNDWVIMHAADPNSVIADTSGPTEAPLQFRVETVKCVDIGNRYSHDKSLDAIQRAKKSATPEEGRESGGWGQGRQSFRGSWTHRRLLDSKMQFLRARVLQCLCGVCVLYVSLLVRTLRGTASSA